MAKIVICFDGTNNHPRNAKQEREWFGHGEIEDNGITNVLKLHCLLGGNLVNKISNITATSAQRSFYYSGVGTYGNKIQQIFNSGFGSSNLDIRTIMHVAGEDLKDTFKQGDEIYIFGFSRGSAIARKFASKLDRYIGNKIVPGSTPIRFVGLFDTVASIGFPNLDDDEKPQSDVVFEDNEISPFIQEALHLLSLDERRIAFQPTLMDMDSRVTEVWFAGAHSDVGGGFWHDGLSDIALKFMIDEIARRNIGITVLDPTKIDFANLKGPGKEYEIDNADVDIKPNPAAVSHQQDRWGPIAKLTLDKRDIRVRDAVPVILTRQLPLIHESVKERMNLVINYRPRALKGLKHRIMKKNGTFDHTQSGVEEGLINYI
ncbi:MAG: DUF2235 domain-containing protein [Colwellia sp.]|nr:DUF2235 domain-containing protein [Colwellia sp.]